MRLIDADAFSERFDMMCDAGGILQPVTQAVREIVKILIEKESTVEANTVESILTDYGFINKEALCYCVEQYQKLIIELTNGKLSKLNYPAEAIIEVVKANLEKKSSKQAHWIESFGIVQCSNCKNKFAYSYRFCPNCGYEMINKE